MGSWQGDPIGTVATRRPPTVELSAAHEAGEGQQLSPGKQRHCAPLEPFAEASATKVANAHEVFMVSRRACVGKGGDDGESRGVYRLGGWEDSQDRRLIMPILSLLDIYTRWWRDGGGSADRGIILVQLATSAFFRRATGVLMGRWPELCDRTYSSDSPLSLSRYLHRDENPRNTANIHAWGGARAAMFPREALDDRIG